MTVGGWGTRFPESRQKPQLWARTRIDGTWTESIPNMEGVTDTDGWVRLSVEMHLVLVQAGSLRGLGQHRTFAPPGEKRPTVARGGPAMDHGGPRG